MLTRIAERTATVVRAHHRLFITSVVALALVVWAGLAGAVWFLGTVATGLPNTEALRGIGIMAQSTTLLDAQDRPAFTIFKEQRIEVPLERISPHLVRAIVSIEDQRFFDHGGVDVIRVAGAAWKNLQDGWGAQGGSTITQQLARQSFLTREKTVRRKLREVVVAARLENEFSKSEILQLYLNKVYFGDGLYGVEAASLGYFGKHAADLTVAEAALLAGLVRSPSTTAPTVSLDRAVSRRNAVLQAMVASGAIDRATYESAVAEEVQLADALRREEPYGQYFKEEVRKQLVEMFGWDRVYEGGLRVYTTLDLDLQKAAEAEVVKAIEEIEERQARRRNAAVQTGPLQAALVALDPRTGAVLAMVGGRSFDESRFNRVTQARRQPGSAFKPFVYAAALERGYAPGSVIRALDTPIMTLQGAWVPDDHSTGTSMTMRAALRNSSNRAAVQMLQEIGIPAAVRAAQRLGLGDVPAVPSLALGSGEVTLLAMTAAFASFANEGMRPEPMLIRHVETLDGEVLYTASPRAERAVSEATAYLMTSMLEGVIDGGTGWQARRAGFRLPAAGKTGTTNEYRDAWFVGYTPNLASGVWLGYDEPQTIMVNGYAGDLAVPLWGRFMATATEGHDRDRFRRPATVTTASICRISGKLATEACRGAVTFDDEGNAESRSTAYTEYFVRGTEPDDYCDYHTHYTPPVAERAPAEAPAAVATSGSAPARQPSAAPETPVAAAVEEAPVAAAAVEPNEEQEPARQPRRGFWSRFFGIGEEGSDPPTRPDSTP